MSQAHAEAGHGHDAHAEAHGHDAHADAGHGDAHGHGGGHAEAHGHDAHADAGHGDAHGHGGGHAEAHGHDAHADAGHGDAHGHGGGHAEAHGHGAGHAEAGHGGGHAESHGHDAHAPAAALTTAAATGISIKTRIKNAATSVKSVLGYEHFKKPPEKTTGPKTAVGVIKDLTHGSVTNIFRRIFGFGKKGVNKVKELGTPAKAILDIGWQTVRRPLKTVFRPDKTIARVLNAPLSIVNWTKNLVKDIYDEVATGAKELYLGVKFPIIRIGQQVERIPKIGSPIVHTVQKTKSAVTSLLELVASPVLVAKDLGEYLANKTLGMMDAIEKHSKFNGKPAHAQAGHGGGSHAAPAAAHGH